MEVRDADIKALREWAAAIPYLPTPDGTNPEDDYILRSMLISSKGSLQQAKSKTLNAFKIMQDHPLVFQPDDILYSEKSKRFNKNTAIFLYPKKANDKYHILTMKHLINDPTDYNLTLVGHRFMFACYLILWERDFGDGEMVVILDMSGTQLGHIAACSNYEVSALIAFANHARMYRVKALHLINLPPYAETLLNLIKKTLSEKMRGRVHVHSHKELPSFYSKDVLPEDYGGTGPPITVMYEQYLERAAKHHDKLAEAARKRAEEAKWRPKGDVATTDTFRQLDID